ncbi:MAG: O-antigen ligase family protein [Acidobacteriota bacterium]|nr:O-antigen ligase family protein [Acidobacteriota bacterium]
MPSKNQIFDYEPLVRSGRGRRAADDTADSSPAVESQLTGRDGAGGGDQHGVAGDAKRWVMKRGHMLSYIGLFLFTVMLYFRPYELFPALAFLSTGTFWIAVLTLIIFVPTQFVLEGRLTLCTREVTALLLLGVTALLSIPLAINPLEAWDTFSDSFIKAVLVFIIMINVVRTERRLKGIIFLSMAVGALLSVNALNDYRSGNLTVEGYRVAGLIGNMFGNPNDMALHLVMMIPIAVVFTINARHSITKVLSAMCVVLMVIGTVVTYSRGGFLGLMAATGVLTWKLGRRNRLTVGVIGTVAAALFIGLAPGNYALRIISIFDKSLDPVASASARQDILIISVKSTLANPIFGLGMGNFHTVSLHELVSHNAYTQVSAELGIPALIFYMTFLLSPLWRLRRIEQETYGDRQRLNYYYFAVGLQASLLSYMVTSFFASVAYLWYVYYMVAYAVCLRRMYASEVYAVEDLDLAPKKIPTKVKPKYPNQPILPEISVPSGQWKDA